MPFCLSYKLNFARDSITLDPTCYAWNIQDGGVCTHTLGPLSPEMTRDFGSQMFACLHHVNLRSDAQRLILRKTKHIKSMNFHLAICPHGAVLVADGFNIRADRYGADIGLSALMPDGLSHHARLASLQGLEACARALFHEQNQFMTANFEIDVRIDLPATK